MTATLKSRILKGLQSFERNLAFQRKMESATQTADAVVIHVSRIYNPFSSQKSVTLQLEVTPLRGRNFYTEISAVFSTTTDIPKAGDTITVELEPQRTTWF